MKGYEISVFHNFCSASFYIIPSCAGFGCVVKYGQGKGDTDVHVIPNGLMQQQEPQTIGSAQG